MGLEHGRRWRVGREGTPVLTVVAEDSATRDGVSLLDDIVREGARRMLAAALEAEVAAYLAELADERDAQGRRLVVRNGYRTPRTVTTSAGAVLRTQTGTRSALRSCRWKPRDICVQRPLVHCVVEPNANVDGARRSVHM
jgi:hypothetical protein